MKKRILKFKLTNNVLQTSKAIQDLTHGAALIMDCYIVYSPELDEFNHPISADVRLEVAQVTRHTTTDIPASMNKYGKGGILISTNPGRFRDAKDVKTK